MDAQKQLLDKRILIVEDEYFIMDEIKRAVEGAGGIVTGACGSVDQTLFDGPAIQSDAAVLDINLQGQMSYQLADALIARGVPFVFATGYDLETIPEQYKEIPRILKPFETNKLVATLANACA